MSFVKYQHVERFGATEVEGIERGTCFVFPKIDGTNASVWIDENGQFSCGSRNRELDRENDNAGFCNYAVGNAALIGYLLKYPTHRLYGEWLVPHSLKTYRDNAWRKFYVFDVCIDSDDGVEYVPYSEYVPLLEEFGIDYIPLLAEVVNGTRDQFYALLEKNQFLIKDGEGAGEGIVIKNYGYKNKYGRTTWAKIVRSEFRDVHAKTMGAAVITGGKIVEEEIVEKFCTTAFIEKEYSKIVSEENGWSSKYIPRLLNTVFYSLVKEECWNFVKEFKNPTVDFKLLLRITTEAIKKAKPEVFS